MTTLVFFLCLGWLLSVVLAMVYGHNLARSVAKNAIVSELSAHPKLAARVWRAAFGVPFDTAEKQVDDLQRKRTERP